ncbi:MAG: sarcosine oxidase [Alphaproteobacteria bacterium]
MTLQPLDLTRRSFIWRKLIAAGARFAEVNACATAMDFGNADAELAVARRMGLADLSGLPRTGYKGRGALDWLRGQGVKVPEENNCALPQPDDTLACRLAPSELLLLGGLDGTPGLCADLDAAWPGADAGTGAYKVPRPETNLWFALTGDAAGTMFSKICGVDLRASHFPNHAIAQTQVARLSAIVVRADLASTPAFHLLADSASAGYVLTVLLDAMAEYDGALVGLSALRRLAEA